MSKKRLDKIIKLIIFLLPKWSLTTEWCTGSYRIPFFHGGFDPGSGLTLVVCLSHASRANLLILMVAIPDG